MESCDGDALRGGRTLDLSLVLSRMCSGLHFGAGKMKEGRGEAVACLDLPRFLRFFFWREMLVRNYSWKEIEARGCENFPRKPRTSSLSLRSINFAAAFRFTSNSSPPSFLLPPDSRLSVLLPPSLSHGVRCSDPRGGLQCHPVLHVCSSCFVPSTSFGSISSAKPPPKPLLVLVLPSFHPRPGSDLLPAAAIFDIFAVSSAAAAAAVGSEWRRMGRGGFLQRLLLRSFRKWSRSRRRRRKRNPAESGRLLLLDQLLRTLVRGRSLYRLESPRRRSERKLWRRRRRTSVELLFVVLLVQSTSTRLLLLPPILVDFQSTAGSAAAAGLDGPPATTLPTHLLLVQHLRL